MKTRRLLKNRHASASAIEYAISSIALISSIAVITIAISVAPATSAIHEHVDADVKAQDISNILLSQTPGVGLSIDIETILEEPETINLPGNTMQYVDVDLYIVDGETNYWLTTDPLAPDSADAILLNFSIGNSYETPIYSAEAEVFIDGAPALVQIAYGAFFKNHEEEVSVGPIGPLSSGSHDIYVYIYPPSGCNDDNGGNNDAFATITVSLNIET